jgi:hypothetical protein
MGFMGGTGPGEWRRRRMIKRRRRMGRGRRLPRATRRRTEGLFKTNVVWRRWWKKEQEERVMNTRREGKACELQRKPSTFLLCM